MPNLTSSSFTNGAPISTTETTDGNGRPVKIVKPVREEFISVENDGRQISSSRLHCSPPQIAQPGEKEKRKVPRQSWPAEKSALTISILKGQAAAKLPPSLSEVNRAIQSLTLTPVPTSGSSSSNTKPERYASTSSPGPDGIDDPTYLSALRTPVKARVHNLPKPPRLARGKRRSGPGSEDEEMSPTERHRPGKRQMREFPRPANGGASVASCECGSEIKRKGSTGG